MPSLALLEGNLILLSLACGNAARERKGGQEKEKIRRGREGSRTGNGQKRGVQHEDFPGGHPS